VFYNRNKGKDRKCQRHPFKRKIIKEILVSKERVKRKKKTFGWGSDSSS
jgi:hypothetical protein